MRTKVLNLKELFSSASLVTRQTARDIFDLVSRSREDSIVLNFKDIQSATRSFFDGLNFYQSRLAFQAKHVEFMNLDSDLRRLSDLVTNNSKVKSDVSYSSMSNVEVIII